MKKIAVIDVGSNSVRLLFVADGKTLYKRLQTTRLGEGIAERPWLKEAGIERTAQAIAEFSAQARADGAEAVYAFATAAVRAAENRAEFLARVRTLCGLSVEVISGETEGEIGLLGALGNGDGGIIDIGGASTEIVVKVAGKIEYKKSVDVGVVRLKDICGGEKASLKAYCQAASGRFVGLPARGRFYAVGGTATTLAARYLRLENYSSERVTGTKISLSALEKLVEELAEKTVGEIAALPCMPTGRADVIVGGGIWLIALLRAYGISEITVSDRDNLEGYAVKKGFMRLE